MFSLFLTVADFQKLQEAKEVLCNETKRKNYDLWKRSGVTIPFHDWQALNDSVKTVCNVFTVVWIFLYTVSCRKPGDIFGHLFPVDALGCEE